MLYINAHNLLLLCVYFNFFDYISLLYMKWFCPMYEHIHVYVSMKSIHIATLMFSCHLSVTRCPNGIHFILTHAIEVHGIGAHIQNHYVGVSETSSGIGAINCLFNQWMGSWHWSTARVLMMPVLTQSLRLFWVCSFNICSSLESGI